MGSNPPQPQTAETYELFNLEYLSQILKVR